MIRKLRKQSNREVHRPSTPPVTEAADTPAPSEGVLRRDWLVTALRSVQLWAFGLFGLVTGLWALIVGRFFVSNVDAAGQTTIDVGRAEEYESGRVETRFRDRFGIWVVRDTVDGEDVIFALKAECTHLGCITLWNEHQQEFRCPCHGSGFDKKGINREGPAPRPLVRCAITRSETGRLIVDTAQQFGPSANAQNPPGSCVTLT